MGDRIVGQAGLRPAGKNKRLVAHLLQSLRMTGDDQLGAANEIGRVDVRAEQDGLAHKEIFYPVRELFAWISIWAAMALRLCHFGRDERAAVNGLASGTMVCVGWSNVRDSKADISKHSFIESP